jgi:hypothetical protein
MDLVAPQPPPDRNGASSQAVNHDSKPYKVGHHWLEYAGVVLAAFAAIAASFAAGFSGWQAWIARDTAERQLRAYVYVSLDIDLNKNLDGSSTFTVTPSAKVFGGTPAAWVSPYWDLKILPGWSSPDEFPELPVITGRADIVTAPGQEPKIGSKNVMLQEFDIASLKTRAQLIIAFGRIAYNDVFGKSRWTDFCAFFDWHDANTNNAELCPKHNDTDWSGQRPPPLVSSVPLKIIITAPSPPAQKSP